MGNNILQYGHAYAWGREYGRRTMSMRFAYKYQYFKICKSPLHNFFVYAAAKYLAKLHLLPVLSFDCSVPYDEMDRKMHEAGNAVVEGWGVRFYDLFLKYRSEIVDIFGFLPKVENAVNTQIDSNESLRFGVHIRRGDYKTFKNGKYFYSDEEYINIIRQAIEQQDNTDSSGENSSKPIGIYICTNDRTINRQNFINAFPSCHVHFPQGNPGEDLCLLSKMDFLIGAPSTFSLVASMYNNTPIYFIEEKNDPVIFKYFEDYFVYDDDRKQ